MLTEKQRILRLECLLLRIYDSLPLMIKIALPKDAIVALNTLTTEITELSEKIERNEEKTL